MRTPLTAIVAAALLAGSVAISPIAAGTATAQARQQTTNAELLRRLQALDAEIADIRARLGVVAPRPGISGGGGLSGEVETEIRSLTAKLERIEQTQRRMADDITRRLGDIEFRLNELEGNPTTGEVKPIAGPDDTASTDGGNAPIVAVSERNLLDQAANDVKQGRYDMAEERLQRFMRDYPESPLAGEAFYWMGQSAFTRGQTADAARAYLSGYNEDRQGEFAGQNLLQLGVALGKLGQTREACLTLREVRTQFAAEELAMKADEEADRLLCR